MAQRQDNRTEQTDLPALLDPAVLRAARQIYQTYYEIERNRNNRPLGVAIDRYTYRGQVILGCKPILLPQECFVPLKQLESEIY